MHNAVCLYENKAEGFDLRKPENIIINKNDLLCLWCAFMCATIKEFSFLAWYGVFFVHPHVIYDGLMQLNVVWVTVTVVCLFSLLYQRNNAHDVREPMICVSTDPSLHEHQAGVERLSCISWFLREVSIQRLKLQ